MLIVDATSASPGTLFSYLLQSKLLKREGSIKGTRGYLGGYWEFRLWLVSVSKRMRSKMFFDDHAGFVLRWQFLTLLGSPIRLVRLFNAVTWCVLGSRRVPSYDSLQLAVSHRGLSSQQPRLHLSREDAPFSKPKIAYWTGFELHVDSDRP